MADLCPKCGSELDLADINVDQGVALCRACGRLSSLTEVVETTTPVDRLLDQPPDGCTLIDYGRDVHIRLSLRSMSRLLAMVFVAAFWNGITSLFLFAALASLYIHLFGELPVWLPVPFDFMPLNFAVVMSLFMIPFVVIGLSLIVAALLAVAGQMDIHLGATQASIRTGLGPFGWTRRFNPADVQDVAIHMHSGEHGTTPHGLVLEGKRRIRFGAGLSEERRDWLRAVLQHLLIHSHDARTGR